jgi:hypothetical protein
MVIALAGRRIDAAGTKTPRFPLQNAETVRTRCRHFLQNRGAAALVCSAACGADLIALSEARQLAVRRRVVLPFGRNRFRQTSVVAVPATGARSSTR